MFYGGSSVNFKKTSQKITVVESLYKGSFYKKASITYIFLRLSGNFKTNYSIENLMMMMMNCFCRMVDRRKAFSLISSRVHCQRSLLLRISDTPQAGFELAQNLSSGLVEWSCAIVITSPPQRKWLPISSCIFSAQFCIFDLDKVLCWLVVIDDKPTETAECMLFLSIQWFILGKIPRQMPRQI